MAGNDYLSICFVNVVCMAPRFSVGQSPNNVIKKQKPVTTCALVVLVYQHIPMDFDRF